MKNNSKLDVILDEHNIKYNFTILSPISKNHSIKNNINLRIPEYNKFKSIPENTDEMIKTRVGREKEEFRNITSNQRLDRQQTYDTGNVYSENKDDDDDNDDDDDDDDETDYYMTENVERMQLNPGADFFYDADDDDYEKYDNEKFYVDTTDKDESVSIKHEILPEPKSLVQLNSDEHQNDNDEEDMGYDEDDERIAMAVGRPPLAHSSTSDKDNFGNLKGSVRSKFSTFQNNLNSRIRADSIQKTKHENQLSENLNRVMGVVAKEGSGNFANDDEDDNDDDDDDDGEDVSNGGEDIEDHGSDVKRSGGYLTAPNSSNQRRYFLKNVNDAIKIISTPLGKVGIVYQQTSNVDDNKEKENSSIGNQKPSPSLTDFDALSPDPESSHRLASSHPKITPVLTPDGKVALLYRGDSENTKYEPIRNITHKYSTTKSDEEKNTHAIISKLDTFDYEEGFNDSSITDSEHSIDFSVQEKLQNEGKSREHTEAKLLDKDFNLRKDSMVDITATSGSFIIRSTDSILPMINRPLSEVLGIKKNQFKQFRIKDQQHATTNPTELTKHYKTDPTTIHVLTKVNLADYSTSAKTRDFDFSRDNTMLDERNRNMQNEQNGMLDEQNGNNEKKNDISNIANEEILSKTEVVNLAIIPHFDEDLERLQRFREHESRRRQQTRLREKQTDNDISGIHYIMQAMMGIAAISTVFGMLGTFFKQRILDQLRLMHW